MDRRIHKVPRRIAKEEGLTTDGKGEGEWWTGDPKRSGYNIDRQNAQESRIGYALRDPNYEHASKWLSLSGSLSDINISQNHNDFDDDHDNEESHSEGSNLIRSASGRWKEWPKARGSHKRTQRTRKRWSWRALLREAAEPTA